MIDVSQAMVCSVAIFSLPAPHLNNKKNRQNHVAAIKFVNKQVNDLCKFVLSFDNHGMIDVDIPSAIINRHANVYSKVELEVGKALKL